MDFNKILDVAKKNELYKKEPIKCFQTKFRPPSKEQHEKDKVLSEGVQKFLARKEEEEKRKQKEAERRKLELMILRGKDPKANKRIQTMLKRTKSANKSVMEDAIDNNNTADTLAGPSQPDEDDYGFVSETSSQLYNKLIQKMYSTPSDLPKFSPSKKPSGVNLSNTKERVKMALLKQEEEEKLPHKRKRKTKDAKDDEDEDTTLNYSAPDRDLKNSPEPVKERPKIRKPLPPPVDFHELLKIAEQKQHEPIEFEPKVKKKIQEPEMLMTKKQRMEYEKMQEWKRQRAIRLQNLENENKPHSDKKSTKSKVSQSHSESSQKSGSVDSQKKVNGTAEKLSNGRPSLKNQDKNEKNSLSRSAEGSEKIQKGKNSAEKKTSNPSPLEKKQKELDDETSRLIRERDEALRKVKEKEKLIRERDEAMRQLKEKEKLIRERDEAVRKLKMLEESERLRNSNSKSAIKPEPSVQKPVVRKPIPNSSSKPAAASNKTNPPVKNGLKTETKNIQGKVVPRQFPPKDLNSSSAKIPPRPGAAPQRSKQFPPADVRRKELAMKRRRIESDDEYDSELDDFIDDGDNDMASEEVSKTISEIFRYDRNKYSKYDDMDDECMESNFAQISKEEYFSSKCGLLEDLEDIRREKARLAKRRKR